MNHLASKGSFVRGGSNESKKGERGERRGKVSV